MRRPPKKWFYDNLAKVKTDYRRRGKRIDDPAAVVGKIWSRMSPAKKRAIVQGEHLGGDVHIDIDSHNPRGSTAISGKSKRAKFFKPFTIGGDKVEGKKRKHSKGKSSTEKTHHKKASHRYSGFGGDPGRRRHSGRQRGSGRRHHGILMGGSNPMHGIGEALLAILSGLVGATGAGYASKFIPGPAIAKNGVPLVGGIALTLVKNPLVKGLGLGMAIVGGAKIIKGFAPNLPLLGDDTLYMLPDGRLVSGDGTPMALENLSMGDQAQITMGDQVAVVSGDDDYQSGDDEE